MKVEGDEREEGVPPPNNVIINVLAVEADGEKGERLRSPRYPTLWCDRRPI